MYGYLTKPIQKQENDKKVNTRSYMDFAGKTGENFGKQETKFSFSKVRMQYNPRESSQTKTHAFLQKSYNTSVFSGGAKPVNNAGAANNTVQCWLIKRSYHYNNNDHLGTKAFLHKIDSKFALSEKLYNKCKGNHGKKHVAFFKLKISLKNGNIVMGDRERIVIVFKWFEGSGKDDDVLMYDTAYYTSHPSPAEDGAVAWDPADPLELTEDEYNEVRGLKSFEN